jgi:two-component system LytT family sensor kinase
MPDLLYKTSLTDSLLGIITKYRVHFICWLTYICYEISMIGMSTIGTSASMLPGLVYFLFYSLNICLFYFHSKIVLRKNYTRKFLAFLYVPLLIIIELGLYFLFSYLITLLFKNLGYLLYQNPFLQRKYLLPTLWRGISFILYATGYYFLISYNQRKESLFAQAIENEKLKNEVLRAEQDFLRAQINPHLLFNTLSFIKYAAKKNPDEADQAVMRLSGIMGFALESNTETIQLTKELEQVENFIELNQLRFNHKLNIRYSTQLDDKQVNIIPIVLLTLVENIFKHGNLMDERYPAEICVKTTTDHIIIKTSNVQGRNTQVISNNKGLLNIRLRLEQTYKEGYEFTYGMIGNLFKVYIKIKLQNN